jgi:hypothetical protein
MNRFRRMCRPWLQLARLAPFANMTARLGWCRLSRGPIRLENYHPNCEARPSRSAQSCCSRVARRRENCHLPAVEAHARIVIEWGRPSIHKMDVGGNNGRSSTHHLADRRRCCRLARWHGGLIPPLVDHACSAQPGSRAGTGGRAAT